MILKSFQNLFFKLILCTMILKSFQNVFFHQELGSHYCHVHSTVLDDVHNVAHLPTTVIVLSSNSMFPLAIQSSKSFLSDFVPLCTCLEFRLRKHSNLMFHQSILIDINVFVYLLIPLVNIP
jgi:hypothetical protein